MILILSIIVISRRRRRELFAPITYYNKMRPLSAFVAAVVKMNNIVYFNFLLVVDFLSERSIFQYSAHCGRVGKSRKAKPT